jgi:glycosyltransferase involved in cell wall biosynthesis
MTIIRLAIQQRVIPAYRAPFLELLAEQPEINLGVFAGAPQPEEMINIVKELKGIDYFFAENKHVFNGKYYLCRQPQFLRWVSDWQPDVLIVEANPRYLSTPGVIRWMHKENRPVIGWGLGVPQYSGVLSGIRNKSREKFLRSFAGMIAYSQKGANQYINAGFNPHQVYLAMNATAAAPAGSPPQRKEWSIDHEPVLLYVGRLQPRKRIDSLIRVCAQLPENNQPNLWIVGDGSIRKELEILAKSIYPKTRFWGEQLGENLKSIFRDADLFVLPGTGGLAVQQAMAHALPVIVAEGDGTQSDLVNKKNGWNISSNNEQELLTAITSALSSQDELWKKGLAAFETVKESVNIEKMVSVFLKASFDAMVRPK